MTITALTVFLSLLLFSKLSVGMALIKHSKVEVKKTLHNNRINYKESIKTMKARRNAYSR